MPTVPEQNKYAAELQEARQQKIKKTAAEQGEGSQEEGASQKKGENKREPKINIVSALLMGCFGLTLDLIGFVPFLEYITLIIGGLSFWVWLKIKGFSQGDAIEKKMLDSLKWVAFGEAIPVINYFIPGWTGFTIGAYLYDNYGSRIVAKVPGGEEALKAVNKV